MRYYEIANMDDPQVSDLRKSRIIDETELRRRLRFIGKDAKNWDEATQMLLHGKVQEPPDPWEEWAEEVAQAGYRTTADFKAALLKLRDLVEKKED